MIVRVAASDPDGIDSLFVIVDSLDTVGADGYFQTSVDVTFPPHAVRSAHVRGQRIPIVASGRDTHGWTGMRDTFAIAKGP